MPKMTVSILPETGQIFQEVERKSAIRSTHILADFSENYSFVLQDAIKGFYWTYRQQILLSFIVYIKDKHLLTMSFCVSNDCLDQNA
jgi:hypothetical protein